MVSNPAEELISVNNKARVNLREVAAIERVTDADRQRMAGRYETSADQYDVFKTMIRFIDESRTPLLVIQDFVELNRRARGRLLMVESEPGEDGRPVPVQVVPLAAIRHLEHVNREDRDAIAASYQGVDRLALDSKKTRIVYREMDPRAHETGRPSYAQKLVAAAIKEDLRAAQGLNVVALGNGKFVIASEIADAVRLEPEEKERLARRYELAARNGEELITSVKLRGAGGDMILSTFAPEEIAKKAGRSLHSAPLKGGAAPANEDEAAAALGDETPPWEEEPVQEAQGQTAGRAKAQRAGRGRRGGGPGAGEDPAQAPVLAPAL